jgi:hypothetical protein
VKFSAGAIFQVDELRRHYLAKGRPEAARNLTAALRLAVRQITAGKSLPAPRPYPELAREGEAWTRAGRYWIAHTTGQAGGDSGGVLRRGGHPWPPLTRHGASA